MNYDKSDIGRRVRALREAKGCNQTQIAEACGFNDHSAVSKLENGKNAPTLEQVIQLAQFFGVSSDYVLRGDALSAAGKVKISAKLAIALARLTPQQIATELAALQARFPTATNAQNDQ